MARDRRSSASLRDDLHLEVEHPSYGFEVTVRRQQPRPQGTRRVRDQDITHQGRASNLPSLVAKQAQRSTRSVEQARVGRNDPPGSAIRASQLVNSSSRWERAGTDPELHLHHCG